MSAPKWTPGPWIADDVFMQNGHCVRVGTYNGDKHYYHASVTLCECYISDKDSDDNPRISIIAAERNARLMATAPELYNALDAIIAADERGQGLPFAEAIAHALVIMSKARGEKQ